MFAQINRALAAAAAVAVLGSTASAAVTPPAGYIYSTQLLSNLTAGCVAAGPGGTFVGIGPGFTVNAEAIVLAKESGEQRLVAMGFNSISDCAYDPDADVLYVTDNADSGELPGALTGDTLFAIPSASSASGLSAKGLEVLPANSVPSSASIALAGSGTVLVSDATGGGMGTVAKITGMVSAPFASGFDFTGGVAVDPATGNVFVAEGVGFPNNQIRKFTPAGTPIMPDPFAGPSSSFGSIDLAFNSDGNLLASGGSVVSFNPSTAASAPFGSGLTFTGGLTVDPFTHRVQVLSSTFTGADEDKSLHRFTPIDQLSPGNGSPDSECLHEAYGLNVVDGTAECTDGAPCDGDGLQNDACLFPIGFCLNVDDSNLSSCDTNSNITAVAIAAKPDSSAITSASTQIAAALPLTGTSCFFSDGVRVPVKVAGTTKKDGKGKVKVKVTAADNRKDSDTYKLVCHPAP
jgi:hypothetical protein